MYKKLEKQKMTVYHYGNSCCKKKKNPLMSIKISDFKEKQDICITSNQLLQSINYCSAFNICLQILWHSFLQEAKAKSPSLENGLDLITCL